MSKKYILELNERQAQLLSWACDTLPRLIQGQDWSFQQLLEGAWEKRCKEATGKMMDEEWDGGWSAMREEAEGILKYIKRRFWGMCWNAHYGIYYDKTADILLDMHTVIRHELWKQKPEPKSHWTVDADEPSQIGEEPLIKIRIEDDETGDS